MKAYELMKETLKVIAKYDHSKYTRELCSNTLELVKNLEKKDRENEFPKFKLDTPTASHDSQG